MDRVDAKQVAVRMARRAAGGGGEPPQLDEDAARVVNALVKELKAIFPAWRQAWPDAEALAAYKRSMVKGFVGAGISQVEQIRFGVAACRQLASDFVPSVGRFIALCTPTPEALGLPSVADAYAEATRHAHPASDRAEWSHPAISHAAREVGLFNLASLPLTVSRELFARAYAITCRALANGEKLRPILVGLPEKTEARCTPEVARAALDALKHGHKGRNDGE